MNAVWQKCDSIRRWLAVHLLLVMGALPAMAQDTPDDGAFNKLGETAVYNFFEIVRVFGNDMVAKITAALRTIVSPAKTIKYLIALILIILLINMFIAWYKSMEKGTFHGFVGEFALYISQHFTRAFTYIFFAMMACGLASIILQDDSWWAKLSRTNVAASKVTALFDQYNPAARLEVASQQMSENINKVNYLMLQKEVMDQMDTMTRNAQQLDPSDNLIDNVSPDTMKMLDMMGGFWMKTIEAVFNLFSYLTFFWGQFMLAKALIVNFMYFKIAWRVGLYFLPYLILLAYFRGFSSYVQNLLKHLFALSVAGFAMAMLAQLLYDPEFWKRVIRTAFENVTFDPTQGAVLRNLPSFSRIYAKWVANAQLGFLLGFIGVIMDRMYDAVKVGLMGSTYTWTARDLSAGTGTLKGTRYVGLQDQY